MQPETVSYCSGGVRVSGWFYSATGTNRPAVVLCPGFTGTKYGAFYAPYVEALVSAGICVLVSDYRGWGDSDGPRGEIVPMREVEDIRNALSFLETRVEVDSERLWLLGFSFGGGVATYVAGMDRRVRFCVAISPVADGELWMRQMRREYEWNELLISLDEDRRNRVLGADAALVSNTQGIMIAAPERAATTVKGAVPMELVPHETPLWCASEILDFKPFQRAKRAARRGLLLFAVEGDVIVPTTHARRILAHTEGGCQLIMLRGGGHYDAYLRHFDTIFGATVEFARDRLALRGDATSARTAAASASE